MPSSRKDAAGFLSGACKNENNNRMCMTVGSSCLRRSRQLLGAAALFVLACGELHATTIFLTSASDSISLGDGCSIREALINANTDSKSGSGECARGSGVDVIVLPPQTINVQGSAVEEDDPRVGDLDVTSDITFVGGGAQLSLLEAGYGGRIFDVHAGGALTVRGMTLQRGMAAQAGGAIRANVGSTLNINDVVIGSAQVSASAVGGKGGAIYIAPSVVANLSRTQIAYNTALGLNGEGGGVYCDSCQLTVTATTFDNNAATASGGALYASAGSTLVLSFVTFGYNDAALGAAMHLSGTTTLKGVISADNAGGVAGDDALCAAGTLTATYSFLEFPGTNCALGASNQTRNDVAPTIEPTLLQDVVFQRFDGQPSGILQWRYGFFAVPAAQCVGYFDQHGRRGAYTDDCDIGAYSNPVLAINPMLGQLTTNGDSGVFVFGLFRMPTVDTVVHVNVLGGIEESCAVPVPDITIPANSTTTQLVIDPDTLFSAPTIDRPFRVCEFELVAISGDSQIVGARTGTARVKLHDTSLASAYGVSSPPPGHYLEFGTVPVNAGGIANILFQADVPGWNILGISFSGADDSGRFSTTATSFPIPVLPRSQGGTQIPIQCIGGVLGDYDALIEVRTDNPAFPVLLYGVRCRVAHLLSFTASNNLVEEAGGGTVDFTAVLDSPSILPGPFTVDLAEVAGSATSGGDYSAFGQTITFNPGEQQHTVTVSVFDDTEIEDTETFGAQLVLAPQANVQLVGASGATTVAIANDDYPVQAMSLALNGIPERTSAGVRIAATAVVTNTGTDPLHDLSVSIAVDAPIRVISFAVAGAACSVNENQRFAKCALEGDVPPGESRTFAGTIEMAEMKDAPMLDLDGVVTVSATATAATTPLVMSAEAGYTLIGQGVNLGSVTGFSLLVLLLLVWRGGLNVPLVGRPGGLG